jgi:hypothetical protein
MNGRNGHCEQEYMSLSRGGKGVVKRYIGKVTGLSRAQVTRLICQYVEGERYECVAAVGSASRRATAKRSGRCQRQSEQQNSEGKRSAMKSPNPKVAKKSGKHGHDCAQSAKKEAVSLGRKVFLQAGKARRRTQRVRLPTRERAQPP